MKRIACIIVALLIYNAISAQCIMLNIKLNDCVSCRNNLFTLQKLTDKLPVFAVFREDLMADSADLEDKLTLKQFGITALYSDELYKRFAQDNGTSNWYIISQTGEVVEAGDLKKNRRNGVYK